MPYLSTSQAFLEQSSLLLEAYPDTTRITTKYTYPPSTLSSSKITKFTKSKGRQLQQQDPSTTSIDSKPPTVPVATLTLKTYNPVTGVCLKYQTKKAAEVGRLISGLGRLAAGAKPHEFSSSSISSTAAGGDGDVEMGDASGIAVTSPVISGPSPTGASRQEGGKSSSSGGGGGGGGGKGKKNKGKAGKR